MTSLAFCYVVRNDESFLARSLKALGYSPDSDDQLIVVDNGSADESVEVGRSFGAHVVSMPGAPENEARNAYLQVANTDWILVLDADEEIPQPEVELLRAEMAAMPSKIVGLVVPVTQYHSRGATSMIHILRAFRNFPGLAYSSVGIHDTIGATLDDKGEKRHSNVAMIRHMDEVFSCRSREKRMRNIETISSFIQKLPSTHGRLGAMHRMLGQEYVALGRFQEAIDIIMAGQGTGACSADVDSNVYLAHAYLGLGDLDRAREAAWALDADTRGPRIQIGPIRCNILTRQGLKDEATKVLCQEVIDFPTLSHPYINLAHVTTDTNKRKSLLDTAIKLDPYLANEHVVSSPLQPFSLFASQSLLVEGAEPCFTQWSKLVQQT